MSSISTELSYGLALDPKTAAALTSFARRRRVLLVLRAIAAGFLVFVAAMTAVAVCDFTWLLSDVIRWSLSLGAYLVTGVSMWWFGLRQLGHEDPKQIARQLESADPRLREDLLSAVELADPDLVNGSPSFRQRLQQSVAARAARLNIGGLLPVGLVQRWLLAGTVVLIVCVVMFTMPRMQFGRRMARAMLPLIAIERASLTEITILNPSPPSGFVAEGDAVGVVAQVRGDSVDDVVLQWRTGDGVEGESIMTPRVETPSSFSDGTLHHEDVFAANLSIGSSPIEYRIIGGDAITLWHELTPLPRPQVESFKKRYVFPEYAKLADRVEEAEHGDLKALAGTLAEVTVRFDEPLDRATLQFGNRGVVFNLDAVEGSDREFSVNIPIRTHANYQVDGTSSRSGLNNPFSPQFSITPVIDTPPVVSWSSPNTATIIVSPLDVVPLGVSVTDDLPLERVVQEFQINENPVIRREIPVPQAGRELNLEWKWDLMRRTDDEEPSLKLAGGDIIRTRMVGIDRRGQRGESSFIELLVAEEGFDSQRHERLEESGDVLAQVARWSLRAREHSERLHERMAAKASDEEILAEIETGKVLDDEHQMLFQRVSDLLEASRSFPEAATLELIGRAILNVNQKLAAWAGTFELASGEDHPSWKASREKALRDLTGQARRISQDASRLEQYARTVFGEDLTVGIVGDAMALKRSLRPLVAEDSDLPQERFPRYLAVAIGRMNAIGDLIKQHEETLPESTRRHLENWDRWSGTWTQRLETSIEKPPQHDAHRSLVRQFDAELVNQFNHGMVDGRLASAVTQLLREIRIQIGSTVDLERQMASFGDHSNKATEQAEKESDSNKVAGFNRDAAYANSLFNQARTHLLGRLEREESLHRSRPHVDLQFAADMNLMQRAVENVTKDGYLPYREEKAVIVHQKLSRAFQTIEAKHEVDMWLGELRELMLAERRLEPTAHTKIKHPSSIERFASGMEWPVRSLQNTGIDWKELEAIDKSRHNEHYQEAKNLIVARRWSNDPMRTADIPLGVLENSLSESLAALQPRVEEARETIRKYVLTLPEQAREAAQKAREAQERTESRPDSQQQTAEQLDEQQQAAEQATRDTLESLVDLANTADFTDTQQRELARDADAAAAEIQATAERAEAAMDRASESPDDRSRSEALDQTAESLEQLADALERTANHFERAEQGGDIADSREQLRQAEEALQVQQELDERFDRAEALADAAQSSPEELMERLEGELARNVPMQEELSDIAERAAEAAQQKLERAAREEIELNRSLERSDPTFQEQKRRAAKQIENLSRRAAAVDQSLLNPTDRAVSQAKTPDARPKLNQAREELREAIERANKMGGENALLSEMKDTATEMSEALENAEASLAEVQKQSQQAQENQIHPDDAQRNRAKQDSENAARNARNQQLRSASDEKRQWSAVERDAGRRIQQAQRQKRDAENRKRQVEQQMARDKDKADALVPRRDEMQKQIDAAVRAETAARETRDFADQQEKLAAQREQSVKNQKLPPLDKANPAAELATRMSETAGEQIAAIRDELQDLAEKADFSDQLRAPPQQAQQLARGQENIEQDVRSAAEQLRRAARHEERLGQSELAEQLDAAAEAVSERAAQAAAEASQSLEQAKSSPDKSPQASQSVANAASEIGDAAQQIADLLAEMAPSSEAAASQPPSEASPSQQKGQQLARTLDELDRAMAQSEAAAQQATEDVAAGQQAAGQQPQEGQSEGGQPPQSPTAADASPTLANAVDSQAQKAARQRNAQLNPSNPGESQPSGPPSDQNASNSSPATQSGSGEMPDGGFVDTMGIERSGAEWGQLRERRTDDAAESRSANVASQYSREIEAYFRAVAKRAAEKGE